MAQADEGTNSRSRIYKVRRTFFGFLYQVLNPDCPYREIVRQIQALLALQAGALVDAGSRAWCQARARLPWDILPRLRCALAARAEQAAGLWRGLRFKVVDGTSTSLPDTAKNQRAHPQPGGQKPGCSFPVLKLVGVFSLATGVLLDHARGNKHPHELNLLQKLMDQFQTGDLVLTDRGFNSYTLLDPVAYPAQELARLYARRWQIELWFGDLKTSMCLERLRCKSPQMVHKERLQKSVPADLPGS